MDAELKKVMEAFIESQKDIEAVLKQSKRRDVWDKIGTLSGLFSALLVALIGYLTIHSNSQRAAEERAEHARENDRVMAQKLIETRMLQVQTIEKFITHAATGDDQQKIALVALRYLGNDAFFAELTKLGLTKAIRDTAAVVAASGSSSAMAESGRPAPSGMGWVFLGTYHGQSGKWETRYLEFAETARPETLANKELRVWEVTGDLNVRSGLPDSKGLLASVVNTLPEGSRVTLENVQRWGASDLYFGLIKLR